ncbi:hypothetical protein WJX77_006903 [Trebouxia sp. C0004]
MQAYYVPGSIDDTPFDLIMQHNAYCMHHVMQLQKHDKDSLATAFSFKALPAGSKTPLPENKYFILQQAFWFQFFQ